MSRPRRKRLQEWVGVDETYCGSPAPGLRGRQLKENVLNLIAAEERGKGIGRTRLWQAPVPNREQLEGFIDWTVESASVLRADGLPA